MQAAGYKIAFHNRYTALTNAHQVLSPQELGHLRTEGTKVLRELGAKDPNLELYRLPELIERVDFYHKHKGQKICIEKLSKEQRHYTLNELKTKRPTEIYESMTVCAVIQLSQLDLFLVPTDFFDPEFLTRLKIKKALPFKQLETEQYSRTIQFKYSPALKIQFQYTSIDDLLRNQLTYWPGTPQHPTSYTTGEPPLRVIAHNLTLTSNTDLLDEHLDSRQDTPTASIDAEHLVSDTDRESNNSSPVSDEDSHTSSKTTAQVNLGSQEEIHAYITKLQSKTIQNLDIALDQTANVQEKIYIGVIATVKVSEELATIDRHNPQSSAQHKLKTYNTILQKLRTCCPNYIQSNKWAYNLAEKAVTFTQTLPLVNWLLPRKNEIEIWGEDLLKHHHVNKVHWDMFKQHLVYKDTVTTLLRE